MIRELVELVNWILAVAMWLAIGRVALDVLTRGYPTVIGRLFRFLTVPLDRVGERFFPRLTPVARVALWIPVFVGLRLALFVVLVSTS
ncbi:hypothetical protein OO015_08920 [Thermomicrobium sp. 4228-Ro]|uniref:hypothetical protein n=1 Tax=Thermomicrobium sp. 4228-Ro TaxID=2993937 RepID=UPI00224926D1|nr:hypothetical protein [Thermomicrobium sp. 4228-Ro]MCX2727615.1 hypothetical protein [Thermomicrobium sp. 4228-Ro]